MAARYTHVRRDRCAAIRTIRSERYFKGLIFESIMHGGKKERSACTDRRGVINVFCAVFFSCVTRGRRRAFPAIAHYLWNARRGGSLVLRLHIITNNAPHACEFFPASTRHGERERERKRGRELINTRGFTHVAYYITHWRTSCSACRYYKKKN